VADFADSAPDPGSVPRPPEGELVPVEGELVPADGDQVGEVRHLPVLAEAGGPLGAPRPVSLPATVAAATGGFILGVVAFVLVRVLRRPSSARLARRRGRLTARRRGVDVETTRSFLVDVHLLKR
jgi:hypothetical protein